MSKSNGVNWMVLPVICLTILTTRIARAELIGWWKFDDGSGSVAVDSSGHGNDGALMGDPTWATEEGHGGVLVLDGTDDYMVVEGNYVLPLYSVALWFRIDGGSTQQNIFGAYGAAGELYGAAIQLETDGRIRYVHRFPFGSSGGTNIYTTGTCNDGAWYHVAIVKTPDTMTLYINGEVVGTAADSTQFDLTALTVVASVLRHDNLQRFVTGAVDDLQLYDHPLTAAEVQKAMEGLGRGMASGPMPADSAMDVPREVALAWTPGEYAHSHDVYLGMAFEDVNEAGPGDPRGTLVSQGQDATTFDPGPLEYGQTYYWRIDEVNGAPDNTVFKGDVWSFTVEPYTYPLTGVTATASSAQPGMEAQNVVNGSGLDGADQHSTELMQMWTTDGTKPDWIQFEFEQITKLDAMWVWNSNQVIEPFIGFGARDVTVEYSTDGETWTILEGVPEFTQATGMPTYTPNTVIDFGGAMARYVRLTIHSNWGGVAQQTGLAEVRFFYVPVQAFNPEPADGATDVSVEAVLDWRSGREATSHTAYLGTDANAVAGGLVAGATVSTHGYTPDDLMFGTPYFWRVDEVGEAGTYAGDVWSFTTESYAVVDDFESYNDDIDAQTTIWHAWIDGLTDGQSGSQVGYDVAPFAEQAKVHGGAQAMPLKYDNTSLAFSEATLTFDAPQDWTARGIQSLALSFAGTAGNAGQLYVKINNTKVVFDGDPADLARGGWQAWNIDLSQAGNVGSVRALTIGVEGAGAAGLLFLDDIRLYPRAGEYITPVAPAATDLVAHYTLDEGAGVTAGDSSGRGHDGTITGALQWAAGQIGGALSFNGTTTDYVEAPEDPAITGTNSRTVAAWIKTMTYGEIASWGENVAGQKWVFRVQESNGTLGAIRIEVNGGFQVGSTDVRDDQWHHVAAVLADDGSPDAAEIELYVDGVLEVNSAQSDEPINTAAGVVRIGLSPWHNRPFTGLIDDVRIYSRPLSAAEVAGLTGRTIPLHKPF